MYLVQKGFFGNPETLSFAKLLVVAYRDFKAFQKASKIICSQTKFIPNFVTRLLFSLKREDIPDSRSEGRT